MINVSFLPFPQYQNNGSDIRWINREAQQHCVRCKDKVVISKSRAQALVIKLNLIVKHLAFLLKYLELLPESFDNHVNTLGSNSGTFIEFLVLHHVDVCNKQIFSI